jgi:secondary thiamine-phosphate synthase enzyme
MNMTLMVETHGHNDWRDITPDGRGGGGACDREEGAAPVSAPPPPGAVPTQETAAPPLKRDISDALERLFPWQGAYGHGEDNAAAHMKVVLMGPSVAVPFVHRKLVLGTWQAIYLCEFDGPRARQVVIHVGP